MKDTANSYRNARTVAGGQYRAISKAWEITIETKDASRRITDIGETVIGT